jgi:hypothetical protein
MALSLTQLIHDMVLEGMKPAKVVAEEIGKPYTTLLREINPYDSGAKVGADLLLPLMHATGSMEPLEYLANNLGYVLVPMKRNARASTNTMGMAMNLLQEFGEFAKTLKTAMENGDVHGRELEEVQKAGYNAATATINLIESLRAVSEDNATANQQAA